MTVTILPGDCLASMAALPAASVDAVVTDPPYHLTSIVKRFGAEDAAPALSAAQRRFAKTGGADRPPGTDQFGRLSKGFMGKTWDGGDIAFDPATWVAVLRVLKPGGHMVAFGAPKNAHRLTCAVEDAGFEIRDVIMWLFGSGFPKSHNLNGEWQGWGTALKPAYEPIILARKPLIGTVAENVLAHGTGAINVDGCRVEGAFVSGWSKSGSKASGNIAMSGRNYERPPKPDADGRWPANVIHDGSDEVLAAFPDAPGQIADASSSSEARKTQHVYGAMKRGSHEASAEKRYTDDGGTNFAMKPGARRADTGSAARFFYCAKAGKADRAGSKHPTVKPLALMRYLCRLVTPPGGTILDPFAGSGTTGQAALEEGFSAVLCEREAEYLADIERRLSSVQAAFALDSFAAGRSPSP